MKTHLISGLFFLLFLPALKAQTDFRFADSTAQWNVLTTTFLMMGPYDYYYSTQSYYVEKDTFFNNHAYQKIYPSNSGRTFLRKDSVSRVYLFNTWDTAEYLLYDFSQQSSDTILLAVDKWRSGYCIVDSVDSVNIIYPRKRMFVTYHFDASGPDIWIDGIGSLNSNFLGLSDGLVCCDGPGYSLLCFYEKDSLLFHDSSLTASCFLDSSTYNSVEQVNEKIAVRINPNPSSADYVIIQSETSLPEQTNFQLFDVTGRMILQRPLFDKVSHVELDGVSKGLFLYAIASNGQKISSGKLAVQ